MYLCVYVYVCRYVYACMCICVAYAYLFAYYRHIPQASIVHTVYVVQRIQKCK